MSELSNTTDTPDREFSVLHEIENTNDSYEVDKIEGNLIYIKGHKYPFKGIPTIEMVEKANEIKQHLKKLKTLKEIEIPEHMLGIFAGEIKSLVSKLTRRKHIAIYVAFVLEYDQGYSLRLRDLFNETTKEKLKKPLEIFRLSRIHKERDIGGHVHKKLKYFFWMLALYSILSRWRKVIEQADFSKLQMDSTDKYWSCMKRDYNYFGKSYAQRQEMIAKDVV